MRSTQATGRLTADPPGTPPTEPPPGRPGTDAPAHSAERSAAAHRGGAAETAAVHAARVRTDGEHAARVRAVGASGAEGGCAVGAADADRERAVGAAGAARVRAVGAADADGGCGVGADADGPRTEGGFMGGGRADDGLCAGGAQGFTGDLGAVDEDVPGAVGRELRELLADRLARSRGLDVVFADDIAERVAGFTQRGGRRIRSRLVWWSLRACGGRDAAEARAALRTAAALELIQTCALIHDDLMDRAPTRRGGPALHADVARQYSATASRPAASRLGASAAVLAGDLALAWADDVLAGVVLDAGLPRGSAHRLNDVWRTLRTEMVAGQYLDVQGQAATVLTLARATRAACLKSALYTVVRPLELGAVLAGADAATTGTLCRAGRCAGLAFQLRDDLDDLFADPRATGKPSGGDVREGKPTYLLAAARAFATRTGDRSALGVLDHAVGRADLTDGELAEVRDVIVATGARDLVETKTVRLAGQCLHHLGEAELEPLAGARLRALLTEITGPSGPPGRPGSRGPSGSSAPSGPSAPSGSRDPLDLSDPSGSSGPPGPTGPPASPGLSGRSRRPEAPASDTAASGVSSPDAADGDAASPDAAAGGASGTGTEAGR